MPTHYQGTAQERDALNAFIKLMRCSDALTARLQPGWEAQGLTGSQFAVLETLLHLGPMCLTEVAAKILRSAGNLTLVAKNLEHRGLVTRKSDAHDRRVSMLHLSGKGRKVATSAFRRHLEQLVNEFSVLSAAEQAQLGALCKKLGLAETLPRKSN
jgi:MarR family 2-MHQ and catechol resistance regulon transcriptional repressor